MDSQKELEDKYKQKTIDRALSVNLSDGIYIVFYYNETYSNNNNQINIFQIFKSKSRNEIQEWIERCRKLLTSNYEVGDALVEMANQKVASSIRYEKAREELIKNNPGFSEETYAHVIHLGASFACH
ncbi:hypothetical protein [Sulfurospirillum halorespirans]|uniref:Uncharacterized protein n=1 Tax=Sulfurospirillum halorespirans DSM 13726 TaxID=1193502 RepID=A0A1D7TI85_9BACT|nr:hypothetical protein [Sulfurospirillum halorespirans]AOO64719.1 hypothetical protein SHALO_0938 [Sulfurospirillum halorespirans DSM 13726]